MGYDIEFYDTNGEIIECAGVRMVNESSCRILASPVIRPNKDLVTHCYDIYLQPDQHKCLVKRDGVVLDEVEGIELKYSDDFDYPKYLLTLICTSTVEPFNSMELVYEKEKSGIKIPKYSINRKNYSCLEVFREKELIEEAVKVELMEGREWHCISRMKLTVIADVNIHIDYSKQD